MNWYIIYISCYLLVHVINLKKGLPSFPVLHYTSYHFCASHVEFYINVSYFWPILHDKQLNHLHSHHTIHIYELFIPIYVITTAPILVILNLEIYISLKLKSCNSTNSSLNSGELFHLCDAVSHLQHDFQLVCPKWDLKNEGGTFQLHLQISLQEIHSNRAYIMQILFSNFRQVLCFLLGNSLASEFYMPTFRNTLSVPSS